MIAVLKRNGATVEFDPNKIVSAIGKAFKDIHGDTDEIPLYAKDIADEIASVARENDNILAVEEIQELVEDYLTEYDLLVAKAYIRYRYKRGVMRSCSDEFIRSISEKLRATNVQNQNANVDEHSFGGRVGEASDEMMKQYALDFCMSEMAKQNHLNNEIYIHDLSAYAVGMHNCLSIPFDKLLAEGFNTRQTDVRPANSINTAFQLIVVIFQLQSLMQFGGVSATHLDWTMVPYVRKSFYKHMQELCEILQNNDIDMRYSVLNYERKTLPEIFALQTMGKKPEDISINDLKIYGCFPASTYDSAIKMTERELQQAVEGMYHNLNTLQSRSGNQLPFTSINYGTCTFPAGRMVINALLEGSLKGVGKFHKTPIFPCGIFQLGKGINRAPGDPNYDMYQLALKSTAKRIYPNYANIDWSGNAGYDKNDPKTFFSTMGKRKLSSCKTF